MESDKFVCVRDSNGDQTSIVIVDLSNKTNARHKIAADSAIMNPISKVLALKAQSTLQIFNLDLKAKMKSHAMPEPVTYWRWISAQTIALVTATAVYHWSVDGMLCSTGHTLSHSGSGKYLCGISCRASGTQEGF